MELEKALTKEDSRQENHRLQGKLRDVELKLNDSVRNEKILEERLKLSVEDKEKLERTLNDKLKRKGDERDALLQVN